jgi:hypothetical protein
MKSDCGESGDFAGGLSGFDINSKSYALYGNLILSLMNALTWFGLFAVTAMLVSYALEKCGPWFILAFAVSCLLGSIYGFLQGAWPFGIVEAIWAVIAVGRWWREKSAKKQA